MFPIERRLVDFGYKVMRTIRLITASILMMFARLIKILTIAVSPKDLKEDFRDMI